MEERKEMRFISALNHRFDFQLANKAAQTAGVRQDSIPAEIRLVGLLGFRPLSKDLDDTSD